MGSHDSSALCTVAVQSRDRDLKSSFSSLNFVSSTLLTYVFVLEVGALNLWNNVFRYPVEYCICIIEYRISSNRTPTNSSRPSNPTKQ